MKDFLKKSIGVIVLLLLAFIAFLSFYRFHFQGGLTNEHSIWSDFGSIFNGILSPIFAAINICIFWYLTKVVDDNNNHRQDKTAKHEKAMILMQFRKAEIDRFDDIISNALVPLKNNDLYILIRPILQAITYIDSFLSTKLKVFDLDEQSNTSQSLRDLRSSLFEYHNIMSTKKDIPIEFLKENPTTLEGYISLKNKIDDYLKKNDENKVPPDLFKKMINLKNSIMTSLQEITLNS